MKKFNYNVMLDVKVEHPFATVLNVIDKNGQVSVTCKNVVNMVHAGQVKQPNNDYKHNDGAYSSPSDKCDDANCQREEYIRSRTVNYCQEQ